VTGECQGATNSSQSVACRQGNCSKAVVQALSFHMYHLSLCPVPHSHSSAIGPDLCLAHFQRNSKDRTGLPIFHPSLNYRNRSCKLLQTDLNAVQQPRRVSRGPSGILPAFYSWWFPSGFPTRHHPKTQPARCKLKLDLTFCDNRHQLTSWPQFSHNAVL
jgi:hypothetical protein